MENKLIHLTKKGQLYTGCELSMFMLIPSTYITAAASNGHFYFRRYTKWKCGYAFDFKKVPSNSRWGYTRLYFRID